MKKVIAINGSPRKDGNTADLLQKALEGAKFSGAETEMIHLIDLQYQGCISCFACKRKDTKFIGSCALKDDLTPVLNSVMNSDVLLLGSPIYLGDVTSLTRAFIERFGFMNTSYNNKSHSNFTGKMDVALFYTMNVSKPSSMLFSYVYKFNKGLLKKFNGTVEQLISTDTMQFNDYSQYEASNFDVKKKKKTREIKFPRDCKKAYEIGARLAR